MNDQDRKRAVLATVWPWKNPASPVPNHAPAAHRHSQTTIPFCIGLTIGLLMLIKFHKPVLGTIVLCATLAMLICALWFPAAHSMILRVLNRFAERVGTALTWILLTPFFYLCFTTGRISMRLTGKDPLELAFPSPRPSFWTPVPPVTNPAHYTRQY